MDLLPQLGNSNWGPGWVTTLFLKAPGPDGLSARVLKECSSEIAPILALI